MRCQDTHDAIRARHAGTLDEHAARQLEGHLEVCDDCRAAARAAAVLRSIGEAPATMPPVGLFDRVVRRSTLAGDAPRARSRFWLGAGVGAAAAAAVMAVIVATGVLDASREAPAAAPTIRAALGVPRNVNIAIEMERALEEAVITVSLSGGIEIEGYTGRRELSWTTRLDAGVNKLTLPIVAVDEGGGRVLVRVGDGEKERRFAMDVAMES